VELQLQALIREAGGAPGSTPAAAEAFTAVSQRLKSWRAAHAAASPEAARKRACEEYEHARVAMERNAINAASAIGLQEQLRVRLTGAQFTETVAREHDAEFQNSLRQAAMTAAQQ
jgi:hypothetical protein